MPEIPERMIQVPPAPGEGLDTWAPRFATSLARYLFTIAYTVNALAKVGTSSTRPATPPLNEILWYSSDTLAAYVASAGAWVRLPSSAILQFSCVSITLATGATSFFGQYMATGAGAEALVEIPLPFAATAKNLHVRTSVDPAAGAGVQSYAFTLRKNEADTALTCTISEGATQAADTTNTVALAQGDRLAIKSIPANTPTAAAAIATLELVASA